MRNTPEILEVNDTQLEDVLCRIQGAVDDKDFALIRALFQSYTYVAGLVEDKNTSIRRLRQLFFGKRTEKTKALVENSAEKSATPTTPRSDAGLPEGGPDPGQAESRPPEASTTP